MCVYLVEGEETRGMILFDFDFYFFSPSLSLSKKNNLPDVWELDLSQPS